MRNVHVVHLLIRENLPGGQFGFLVCPHDHWRAHSVGDCAEPRETGRVLVERQHAGLGAAARGQIRFQVGVQLRPDDLVLSACDSQRGRLAGVEGVFGMPWGFMYAGSPAVIASLWQVDDASTAELMGNLYAEIHQISAEEAGESEAAKLAAFVAVRRALRRTHRHPYYWAPFIYLGDPR